MKLSDKFNFYYSHKEETLGADADTYLRDDRVPEGYILEVQHLIGTGNNAGAGEYIYIGYTRGGHDFFLYNIANTGATNVIVRLPEKMYLMESDQACVRFEEGNNGETLELNLTGILWDMR